MFDQLKSRLDNWSQENNNKFHNYVVRSEVAGKYMWDITDNGYYLTKSSGSYFMSNDGEIHILSTIGNQRDWDYHNRLLEITYKTPVRIDIPVSYSVIDALHYKVFHRPNKEFGTDYHVDIFENLVDDRYFEKYVDNVTELLLCFKELGTTLPSIGMTPMKRLRDSMGHFFSDFKAWTIDLPSYIQISLGSLNTVVSYLNYNNVAKINKEKLLNYASNKWTIL